MSALSLFSLPGGPCALPRATPVGPEQDAQLQHQAVSGPWPFFPAAASLGARPCPAPTGPDGTGMAQGGAAQAPTPEGREQEKGTWWAVLCLCVCVTFSACRALRLGVRVTHGLINPQGVMLSSHFLLLLSPAAASWGHSSSVMSTCD